MNRSTMRALVARGLLAATAAATVTAVGVPTSATASPATGVPAGFAAQLAADPEWQTTEEDKVRACSVLGIDPEPSLLLMSDRDFVYEIWKRAQAREEIRATAELALMENDPAGLAAFIQGGIHDAQARQVANDLVASASLRAARELRRSAAAQAKLVATEAMLMMSEKDFVVEILLKAPGKRVRAAAEAALKGTAAEQHKFLVNGVAAAAELDLQDYLQEIADRTEAEKQQAIRDAALRRAAAVLGIVADDSMLILSDDNFIRAIWKAARPGTEVQAAANKALYETDPAAWRAFIDAGIHVADRADLKRELDEKAAADRRLAEQVLAEAQAKGAFNLAAAARAALAGSPNDVADFLRVGRYQVRPEALDNRADITLVYGYADGALAPFTFARDTGTGFGPRSGFKSPAAAYDIKRVQLARGDFNGDKTVDQAVLHAAANGTITLDTFLANPDGTYRAPLRSWSVGASWGSIDAMQLTSGDYNGDGRVDLAAVYDYPDNGIGLLTWTAKANGGFNAPFRSWYNPPKPFFGDLARMKVFSGDFNGDGRADVGSFYGYADKGIGLLTFASRPDGGFVAPFRSWYNPPAPYWGDLAKLKIVAGDFNGDKRTDVAGLYSYANKDLAMHTFTAKADGGFTNPAKSWSSNATAWGSWDRTRIVAGDYNADGRDDVAALYGYADEGLSLNTMLARPDGGFDGPTRSWYTAKGQFGWFNSIKFAGEFVPKPAT